MNRDKPIKSKHVFRRKFIIVGLFTLVLLTFGTTITVCAIAAEPTLGFRVVDLLASERYEEALSIADSLIQQNPTIPIGYFNRMLSLNARTIDYEDEADLDDLFVASDSVTTIIERLIDEQGDSPEFQYFLGTVDGLTAYYHLRSGNPIKTYFNSIESARHLADAIEMDSTYWDAYLGLGLYYYHRSSRAGLLRTIGIIGDRRREGLDLMKIAARKGAYSCLPATSARAWIMIDEGSLVEAVATSRELLLQYPNSRSFHWLLGKALKEAEMWQEAAFVYSNLLVLIRNGERNNHYNELGCLHALATCYNALGRWADAVTVADSAMQIRPSDSIRRKKSKDIKNIRRIRRHAEKELKSHR